ncbi:hypothetical protein CEXT_66491 [Caerostris extrusa]|uniref:Uncharacterized protein n=1 Tax=Caerostris extrusa TaxID=172846 RepID=A0AAV4RWE3_CAEEX|nr:hypothetical protein CEXT_66491 [Caerostris extrusa]
MSSFFFPLTLNKEFYARKLLVNPNGAKDGSSPLDILPRGIEALTRIEAVRFLPALSYLPTPFLCSISCRSGLSQQNTHHRCNFDVPHQHSAFCSCIFQAYLCAKFRPTSASCSV